MYERPGSALGPAVGFLGLILLSCDPDRDQGRQTVAAEPVTITVLVPDADERALGPQFDGPQKLLVFMPLATGGSSGSPEGRLARSWEHSPDYATWTIHLNTGVRWHDGAPVTSEDIAFSVELMAAVGFGQYTDVEIEIADDSTFVWRSKVNTPLDGYLSFFPKHLLGNLDIDEFWDWEFWKEPVGSGPYRYVHHVERTMTELEANPQYFRGRPPIDRVILKYGSGEGALLELTAGNVDLSPLQPMDLAAIESDPRFQVAYTIGFWDNWAGYGIMWNHRHPILGDSRIRRAATLALDRQMIHSFLHLPADVPIFDVLFTERQLNHLPEPLQYDPDAARLLLEEAGWRDTDHDGIRERDGEEFTFALITATGRGDDLAVIVQAQLRDVGMGVGIETVSDPQVAWNTRLETGSFDAALLSWNPGAYSTFGPESFLGYRNEEEIRLLEEALFTLNPEVKDSLYRQLWPHFQTDVPVTFLFPRVTFYASTRRARELMAGAPFPMEGLLRWESEPPRR